MTMREARSSGKRHSGAAYQILPAARVACHVSSAAAPSVGRWPSRVSKARLSKALISLSSTTSTERLFLTAGVLAGSPGPPTVLRGPPKGFKCPTLHAASVERGNSCVAKRQRGIEFDAMPLGQCLGR